MPRESRKCKAARAARILTALKQEYPDASTALEFGSPWELLVATMLSAQCTDEKVNEVTGNLFRKYRTVADYASADPETFAQEIYSTGFYQKKARAVVEAAQAIQNKLGGALPESLDDLLALPGVARKTANVVMGVAFRKPTGIAVDTHVSRLALRMRLTPRQTTKALNTDRIERDLMAIFPREEWIGLSLTLILHGRAACRARRPQCETCCVAGDCPKVDVKQQKRK